MTNLIMNFPVLQDTSGDFVDGVEYHVDAEQDGKQVSITHTLAGESFISELVRRGDAVFSVLLLYRDSSERQLHRCNPENIASVDGKIVATQTVAMKFSYPPEVAPSIVACELRHFTVDNSTGCTEFWQNGSRFTIPKFARVAISPKLRFFSGDLSGLIQVELDKKQVLEDGEIKVTVREHADYGESPVTILCGVRLFDELKRASPKTPSTQVEALRHAVFTQALTAAYAYMHERVAHGQDYQVDGVLAAHQNRLAEKTKSRWGDDDFNPSFAATRMSPYATNMFVRGDDDE